MRLRRAVPLICIAGGLLLAQAGTAQAMYWGATIDGDVYGQATDAPWNQSVWNTFEKNAGKKVTMVQMGQQWGTFDTAAFQAARNRGAIPVVSTGLPQGVTLADVANGSQDAVINAWAQQAKAWGYPFLFRPWWEMNGDWYSWGRDPNFIAAWRHFHDLVVADGATNVTWAWVINGLRYAPMEPAPYYPGSAYVDWVGVDTYNWGTNPLQPDFWQTPTQVMDINVNRLQQIAPGKPICICETASTEIGGNKVQWIRDLLGSYFPKHPEIKAFLWMNWNVPQNGGRWDWQIESSSSAQQAFRVGIRSGTYRSTLPPLTPLAKLPLP